MQDHDDVIKWKHLPRYWPFVRGIHRSPVNSPHKGQWRGALMFSLICARINDWVNNREVGDLRRYRAHYDVIVMLNMSAVELPQSYAKPWKWSDVRVLHFVKTGAFTIQYYFYILTWNKIATRENFPLRTQAIVAAVLSPRWCLQWLNTTGHWGLTLGAAHPTTARLGGANITNLRGVPSQFIREKKVAKSMAWSQIIIIWTNAETIHWSIYAALGGRWVLKYI